MKAVTKKSGKGKKPPLTPQDELKRDHFSRVRALFRLGGFKRIAKLSDKEFTFRKEVCDFDDVFVRENILVLVEYTVHKDGISKHLKNKRPVFDAILDYKLQFLEFLAEKYPAFVEASDPLYDFSQYQVVIAYASRFAFSASTKDLIPRVRYLDYNVVRYLESVGRTVRDSSRFELFAFLGLQSSEVGAGVLTPDTTSSDTYNGSVLPESHSNYGKGFKIVSCYLDPEALLRRAYVLRRDGWRGGSNLYQRMISKGKVEAIRRYLKDKKRVFINNIVVTLPSDTKIVDNKGDTIDVSNITKTSVAKIQLPDRYNCIGLIDGQHRVYSYYEGGSDDDKIGPLRKRQNLLVSGIIFPNSMSDDARARFEANLFLEINSTQTNAKSDLKQEIELMLRPFSAGAIAKRVMNHLNDGSGPLSNEFERFFYDADKLKTTSIVSYGLSHLVRPGGQDSFFGVWKDPSKPDLLLQTNDALLAEYVQFCASEVNKFMSAVKEQIPTERWTADRKVANRFLSTAHLNGCIACLRRIVKAGKTFSREYYLSKLSGLESFDFGAFKSSQYNKLGALLYSTYFGGSAKAS